MKPEIAAIIREIEANEIPDNRPSILPCVITGLLFLMVLGLTVANLDALKALF